jgi:hypothetical protein
MSNKIKYNTGRNGEFKELSLNCTTLIMPDSSEYTIRWDEVNKAIEIVKNFGANDDDSSSMVIMPCVSNKILIK